MKLYLKTAGLFLGLLVLGSVAAIAGENSDANTDVEITAEECLEASLKQARILLDRHDDAIAYLEPAEQMYRSHTYVSEISNHLGRAHRCLSNPKQGYPIENLENFKSVALEAFDLVTETENRTGIRRVGNLLAGTLDRLFLAYESTNQTDSLAESTRKQASEVRMEIASSYNGGFGY